MSRNRLRIALISNYPAAANAHSAGRGTASYTHNLCKALLAQSELAGLLVLSEREYQRPDPIMEILPAWNSGLWFPFTIFAQVWRRRREIDLVHLQYEFHSFGHGLAPFLVPLLLLLLRLAGRPLLVTQHGVIDIKQLAGDFSRQHGSRLPLVVVKLGFLFLQRAMDLAITHSIVHFPELARRLQESYGIRRDKVSVLAHGIEQRPQVKPSGRMRQRWAIPDGQPMLLFFGHQAGYKGLSLLVEAMALLPEHYHLILGGAQTSAIQESLQRHGVQARVKLVGFIDEQDFPDYFAEASCLVLPYPDMNAASGPFALAVAYACPAIVTEAFAAMYDYPEALRCRADAGALAEKIQEFFINSECQRIAKAWMQTYKDTYVWPHIAAKTTEIYHSILPD